MFISPKERICVMKRVVVLVVCLSLLFTFLSINVSAVSPEGPIPAEYVYLVNTDTETVVYEKNGNEKAYPASLTKIMTAIIALEKTQNLDAMEITAPAYIFNEFYGIGVSNAEIARGEVFTMRELLYALMLNSACEAASIIADHVGGGSIEAFVDMMNDKAKEIGATNTNFVNAHGLFDENQYTTPHDMYLIAKYAVNVPGFMEIASTKSWTIEGNDLRTTKNLVHTNRMLFTTSSYYMGKQDNDSKNDILQGIKTGTLEESGRNLITVASNNGYNYLCVIMGGDYADKESHYKSTKSLYEWAFENFRVKTLLDTKKAVTETKVILSSDTDHVLLKAAESITALVPVNIESSSVVLQTEVPEFVKAPIKAGDVIGKGSVLLMGEVIATVDLVAVEDIERSTLLHIGYSLLNVMKSGWFVLGAIAFVALLILYIILSIMYSNYKRRNRKTSVYSYRSMSDSKSVKRRKL